MSPARPDWVEARQRRDGWAQAHEARGLLPGPEIPGDWSAHSGYLAGARIARDPDVTAVFAANDAMALGLMRALHEAGRSVPDEISVVGFDDSPESAFYWPPLTTVAQEFSLLGRHAVELTLRAPRRRDLRRHPPDRAHPRRPLLHRRPPLTRRPGAHGGPTRRMWRADPA